MDRFHPPGFLADFARRPDSAEDRAKAWSAIVSAWMDNAAEALESGYNGTTFSLFPGEEALVLAAKASTLADFAQQVISGQPVQPERTRTYRPLETFGTAYTGRGIPAIAAFRAP